MDKTLLNEAKQREGIYGYIGFNWFKNALKRKNQNLIWEIDKMIADKSDDARKNPVLNGYVGGLSDVLQMLHDMNCLTDEGIVLPPQKNHKKHPLPVAKKKHITSLTGVE